MDSLTKDWAKIIAALREGRPANRQQVARALRESEVPPDAREALAVALDEGRLVFMPAERKVPKKGAEREDAEKYAYERYNLHMEGKGPETWEAARKRHPGTASAKHEWARDQTVGDLEKKYGWRPGPNSLKRILAKFNRKEAV